MNPLEKQLQELQQLVQSIVNVENVDFIKNMERRIPVATHSLADHSDVSGTGSATAGQVLKKTATTWQPGTDIDT